MAGSKYIPNYSIKTIWGLAKSPELNMDDETLHDLVYRETRKESIRKLTKADIDKVCKVLMKMKESSVPTRKKGNKWSKDQRTKIDKLTEELGWSDNPARLNGFVKRMFKIDRVEWLDPKQCSVLIEALKKMVARVPAEKGAD